MISNKDQTPDASNDLGPIYEKRLPLPVDKAHCMPLAVLPADYVRAPNASCRSSLQCSVKRADRRLRQAITSQNAGAKFWRSNVVALPKMPRFV